MATTTIALARFSAGKMGRVGLVTLALAGAVAVASPAAADPTGIAVVESLTGNPSGVEFMDYVRAGQVIRLGPHQNHRAELYGFMCAGNHYGGTVTAVQELRELRPTALTDSCIASSLVGSVFVERRKLLYLQSFAVASFAPSART